MGLKIIIPFLLLFSCFTSAQETKKIYKYKKYEKFDFAEINLQGNVFAPSDLSVVSRFQKSFKNKLPYKYNFNPEIKRSLKRVD